MTPGNKLRIMLLDRSPLFHRQLETNLKLMRECEIENLTDIRIALQSISKSPPDLIMAEWDPQDCIARDLLKALKTRDEWQRIPVLVSHSRSDDQVFIQSIELGAIGVMFKPFNLKMLRRHIDALFPPQDLQEETPRKDGKLSIRTEIKLIGRLAPMPHMVQNIFKVCNDPTSSGRDLADEIKVDQALTTKVLKIVNSAYYGFHREIGNVDHAVVVLGFEEVKNITLAACIIHTYPYSSNEVFNRDQFWLHSMSVAYVARSLRSYVPEIIPQDAFVIGLLHDFGKVVLSQLFHKHFLEVVQVAAERKQPLHVVEREFADIDHAEIGSLVGESWDLPPALIRSIQYHHDPGTAYRHEYAIHLVHLANYFCHVNNVGSSGNSVPDEPHPDSLNAFGFELKDLDDVWSSLQIDVDAIRNML